MGQEQDTVTSPEVAWVKPANALELIAARAMLARATAQNLPSPCISVCRMKKDRSWCEGCYRSIDEIRRWSTADDDTKRSIWLQIEQRFAPELA